MRNKERLMSGKLYKDDDEIKKMKEHGRKYNYLLNQCAPHEMKRKEELVKKLFGSIGKNFYLKTPFYCSHGTHIEIGDDCFINYDCIFQDLNHIKIGNHVLFGPRVSLYTASHPIDLMVRRTNLEFAKPITIEDDVWIGGNVVVLPGVTINKGSIVGAGSVVTHDIPENVIVGGNPARILRQITDEDTEYWEKLYYEYLREEKM